MSLCSSPGPGESAMSTNVRQGKTDPKQHDQAASDGVRPVEQEVKPLQALLRKFNNDWSMNLSAALAYNLLLAIVPVLVTLLSILGWLLGSVRPDATAGVLQGLTSALPKEINAAAIVRGVEQNLARSPGLLALLAVLTGVFG